VLDRTVTNDVVLSRDLAISEEPSNEDQEECCEQESVKNGQISVVPEWFCVQPDAVAFYSACRVHLMEYKL